MNKKNRTVSSFLLCAVPLLLLAACGEETQSGMATSHTHHDASHALNHSMNMQSNDGDVLMQSMSSMMDEMHNLEMSGDPDKDFAEMMVIHHQGAVDMAKAELAFGKDTVIRNMASSILSAQKSEIAKMQAIISSLPKVQSVTHMDRANDPLMKSMNGMMDASHNTPMSGDVDRDFVTMMIPHHEGAVEMAKVQVRQGRNAALKKMAQQMIDDQTREIGQFRQWLSAQP